MDPIVSIVMPVRDAAATLPQCLASIERQTLTSFELIAIDDGSRDESTAIIAQCNDQRVRLLCTGRLGFVDALNLGISEARSLLIARMDADDVMHHDRLRQQVQFLSEHQDVSVVGCLVELFADAEILAGFQEYVRWQNSCVTPDDIANNIYVESPLPHPSVMYRKTDVLAAGGYRDGDFPEDYELWLRMASASRRFAKVPSTLLRWRERIDRLSRTDPRYSRSAFDRLRADYLGRDGRVNGRREVVIWGAGRKTRQRAQLLIDRGVKPSAWIDIDPKKISRMLSGVPVHSPEWLADRDPRPFVLVYVTSHGARDLIAHRLAAYGYAIGEDFLPVG